PTPIKTDCRVGPKFRQRIQHLFISASSNHSPGPQQLRGLDREFSSYSSCAEYQNALSRDDLRPPLQRAVCRQSRIENRSGGHIANIVRESKTQHRRHSRQFGHRIIRRSEAAKENSAPILKLAHTVRAAHYGETLLGCIVRPARQLPVNGLERSGANPNQRFTFDRARIRKILTPRSLTNSGEYSGFHQRIPPALSSDWIS